MFTIFIHDFFLGIFLGHIMPDGPGPQRNFEHHRDSMRVFAPKFYVSAATGPGDVFCCRFTVGRESSFRGGVILFPLSWCFSEGQAPYHSFMQARIPQTFLSLPHMPDSGFHAGRTSCPRSS